MAIAFDAKSEDYAASTTSQTFSHTTTGSNLVLTVDIMMDTETAVSNVTFDGVALTKLAGTNRGSPNFLRIETWEYKACPAKTGNVVVTHGGTIGDSWVVATSYTGVDQTTPSDSIQTAVANTGFTVTDDVISESGDLVVAAFGTISRDPVVGAGQTARATRTGPINTIAGMVSEEAGAATVTMSHSWAVNAWGIQHSRNLNAAAAGGDPEGPLIGGKLIGGGILSGRLVA